MRQRRLGVDGPMVSAVGLGCMGLVDGYYGPVSTDEATRAVRYAIDLGYTLFDTADSYGAGQGEQRLGAALSGRRDSVVVATKVGLVRDRADGRVVDGRPEHIRASVEASLRSLQTEFIDLYQLHRVDPDVPVEESIGAMGELVDAGLVRGIGVSEVTVEQLRRAVSVRAITAVQSEYSLLERGVEDGVLAECDRLGCGLLTFAPLGKGLLTGTMQSVQGFQDGDLRARLPRFGGEHLGRNQELIGTLGEIADELDVRVGQLALAWVLSRSPLVVPIPGSLDPAHLSQNAAAEELELSDEVLRRIDAVMGRGSVSGDRYPAGWQLPTGSTPS